MMEATSPFFSFFKTSETSTLVISGCVTMVLAGLLHRAFCDRRKKQAEIAKTNSTRSSESSSVAEGSVDLEKYPGGQVTVYFGTQTGTAESFARDLERQLQGFLVHVVDLEDVKSLQTLAARSIFLTATYGEGESPDNAALFCNWLEQATGLAILDDVSKASVGKNGEMLSHVEFACFGLGNKQYDHYNAMGKHFDRTFELLGAKRMANFGMGDDDDDIEADFETWKEQALLPVLKGYLEGAQLPTSTTTKSLPNCPIKIKYHDIGTTSTPDYKLKSDQIYSTSRHYFTAVDTNVTAVQNLRTTKDPGSTLHIELDATNLRYTTADNLGVLPVNDKDQVERLAKALKIDAELLQTPISLQAAEGSEWQGVKFPQPETVFNILCHYYDIQAAPRRADLAALADFCTDKVDRAFLERLASKDGRVEYKEKIMGEYIGWVDLIERLPSLHIPLEHLLQLVPQLQQRFYTIASSSLMHPKSIHLTVSLTEHKRPNDGSLFQGVCTRTMAIHKQLRVTVRPSAFRLPPSPATPVILIGPGTGIAPMRAFLQERAFQKQKQRATIGTTVLYFGCKRSDMDYIYQEELASMQKAGVLHQLRVAFSREQPNKKVYVQHLLGQNADETWDLVDRQGAYVYVCGGVQMGNDVSEALASIVSARTTTTTSGKDYLAQMSHTGRYVQELWA